MIPIQVQIKISTLITNCLPNLQHLSEEETVTTNLRTQHKVQQIKENHIKITIGIKVQTIIVEIETTIPDIEAIDNTIPQEGITTLIEGEEAEGDTITTTIGEIMGLTGMIRIPKTTKKNSKQINNLIKAPIKILISKKNVNPTNKETSMIITAQILHTEAMNQK